MTTASPLDAATRLTIVAGAVAAAGADTGDGAWAGRVEDYAAQIFTMGGERSHVARMLTSLGSCKVFTGAVLGIQREQSSTRGIVTLKTGTSDTRDGLPAGCEQVRTDRTDSEGRGLRLARQVRTLIGHRVLVWVEVEEYNGGRGKVRVLRHVEDLGRSDEPEAQAALAALAGAR